MYKRQFLNSLEIQAKIQQQIIHITFEVLLSNDDTVSTFQRMFPDSKIASAMTLKKDKLAYLIKDALFPYCQQELTKDLQNSVYSLQIDEANKCRSHLGIVVRYMKGDEWQLNQWTCPL